MHYVANDYCWSFSRRQQLPPRSSLQCASRHRVIRSPSLSRCSLGARAWYWQWPSQSMHALLLLQSRVCGLIFTRRVFFLHSTPSVMYAARAKNWRECSSRAAYMHVYLSSLSSGQAILILWARDRAYIIYVNPSRSRVASSFSLRIDLRCRLATVLFLAAAE